MIQRANNIIFVVGFEITIEAKKKISFYTWLYKKKTLQQSYLIDVQYTVIVLFYDSEYQLFKNLTWISVLLLSVKNKLIPLVLHIYNFKKSKNNNSDKRIGITNQLF